MASLSRRSMLRGSLGLAAASTLPRPYIANAAATTATVWWTQGFVKEEDASFQSMVQAYEKASGNKIDYTLTPFAPLGQRIISALTSGDVPDLISHDGSPARIVPQNAWVDKLVDMSDVVETQKQRYHPTALLATQYYNNVKRERGVYLAPYKTNVLPFHVWNSLVEKAGYKLADAPKTWDAFWDFFKPMQQSLREKGMRGVYSIGLQMTTVGPTDGNYLFLSWLFAYGGIDLVTPDGRAHLDDPMAKEAVIKLLTYWTDLYKGGYVPPGAVSWNDADDNNAFHARQFVMDLDGTISTEIAMFHDKEKYDDAVTMGLPADNAGKPIPSLLAIGGQYIPKGARNIEVAKDFAKFVIQPEVSNAYLKGGLGRWLPAMPEIAKNDPFWLDPKDPHVRAYTLQGVFGPTAPNFSAFNPGYGEVEAQQTWGVAASDIVHNAMTPEAATEKAFARVADIFARYPIAQS